MTALLLTALLPLAQAAEEGGERGYEMAWALILLSIALGMMIACRPAKRELEVRKPKKA